MMDSTRKHRQEEQAPNQRLRHGSGQAQSYNSDSRSATSPRSRNSQTGQAIFPLVLVLTAVFGLIGVTFAGVAYLQSLLSSQRAFAEQALQASSSGVSDALLRIARDKTYTDVVGYTLDVDGITATVTVDGTVTTCGGSQTCRQIDSSATKRGVARSLRVTVEVAPSGATKVLSRIEVTN